MYKDFRKLNFQHRGRKFSEGIYLDKFTWKCKVIGEFLLLNVLKFKNIRIPLRED